MLAFETPFLPYMVVSNWVENVLDEVSSYMPVFVNKDMCKPLEVMSMHVFASWLEDLMLLM